MNLSVKLNNMGIILSLILLFSATCYSTPGWAEEFIMTKDSSVVESSESGNGIVITKWRGNEYYVTHIYRDSYSFYPNYILGKCDVGLFAYNETTNEVNYFDTQKELDKFKSENDLGYSFGEIRLIKMRALKYSFLATIIILLVTLFLKNSKTDIILLKKRFLFIYLALYIITKLFHMFYAYMFLYDPNKLFSPDSVFSILVFSVCFVAPWLLLYRDYKNVKTFKNLKWNSILFVLLLMMDFWIISISYFWSGLFRYYVIYFVLLCNLLFILFYGFVLFVTNKIKKVRSNNSIIQESI